VLIGCSVFVIDSWSAAGYHQQCGSDTAGSRCTATVQQRTVDHETAAAAAARDGSSYSRDSLRQCTAVTGDDNLRKQQPSTAPLSFHNIEHHDDQVVLKPVVAFALFS